MMPSGTGANLYAVWGSSAHDVFAVGAKMLHYDGNGWTEMLNREFSDVWGSGPNDVFAVGGGGTVFHYDGDVWLPMASGTDAGLRGIWGSSSSDVFAVGDGEIILHYDGNSWEAMTMQTPAHVSDSSNLVAVWGSSASDVYAVGHGPPDPPFPLPNSYLLHYNGDEWTPVSPGLAIGAYDIWGSGPEDVYLVGNDTNRHDTAGAISHYDGSSWVQQYPAYDFIYGVWGSSMNDVFAVGRSGAIQHFDGTSWHSISSEFTSVDFNAVMGTEGQDLIVVGERITQQLWGGHAYHYDRSNFVGGLIEGDPITGVWAYSNDDIYVVSAAGVLHYDGTEWNSSYFPKNFQNSLIDIWGR